MADMVVNCIGGNYPVPLVQTRKAINAAKRGQTVEVMGIKKEDLDENLIDDLGAVGTYVKEARESDITLFI
jgi:peroxiredoxin family protein